MFSPLHHSEDYIFWSFGIMSLKVEFCRKGVGGMADVAYFITDHDQIQLNRFCYLHFCSVFLTSKGFYYSELI